MSGRRGLGVLRNPAQTIVVAYGSLILIGAVLLGLPLATTATEARLAPIDALFMSTSATTITGLSTVDPTQLSVFGQVVLIALVQVGGFGIMTIGAGLAVIAARHLGLRQRRLVTVEMGTGDSASELATLIKAIAKLTIVAETVVAIVLFFAFWIGGHESFVGAIGTGVFHSISAFNNAGFSTFPDSLEGFVGNPFVILPISAAFIVGGLGFPVLTETIRRYRMRRAAGRRRVTAPWSIHAKVTAAMTLALVVIGPLCVIAFEWTNEQTLGPLDITGKLLAGWLQGVSPRSAGFNSVPTAALNETTLVVMSVLMFIGGGPVSTAGGIKVTSVAVLTAATWSEVRGERDTHVFRRRLPENTVRQAVTAALLGVSLVFVFTLLLMASEGFDLTSSIFEVTSAFGTAGLTTGVTDELDAVGHYVVMALMLIGRVGVVTFVTAVALTDRARAYRLPEERVLIG
ncbi:MAG: potassium transporter TrkG [Ilumatobacteraceae bacterium]